MGKKIECCFFKRLLVTTPIETVDTHPLLTTMAIYHSLVCYSNLVPSDHRPHSRPRRLFRKLRSCHASIRASFIQKRCQCFLLLIYNSPLDGSDIRLCINEFRSSLTCIVRVTSIVSWTRWRTLFILRIEVGDSQHRGTRPLEEFDAHHDVSFLLVFWSSILDQKHLTGADMACLRKKVSGDGAAQPPNDPRPHRRSSTFLDHFRGKFCESLLVIYLIHRNELIYNILLLIWLFSAFLYPVRPDFILPLLF